MNLYCRTGFSELFVKCQFCCETKHTTNITAGKVTIWTICSTDSDLFCGFHPPHTPEPVSQFGYVVKCGEIIVWCLLSKFISFVIKVCIVYIH